MITEKESFDYWRKEIERLTNERNEIARQFENFRQKTGNYLEQIQPLLAATFQYYNGKPTGAKMYEVVEIFWENYWKWIPRFEDFIVPLKDFEVREWIETHE